jgi:hypothetical protein
MPSKAPFIWQFVESEPTQVQAEGPSDRVYDDRTQRRWTADEIIFQATRTADEQTGTATGGGEDDD